MAHLHDCRKERVLDMSDIIDVLIKIDKTKKAVVHKIVDVLFVPLIEAEINLRCRLDPDIFRKEARRRASLSHSRSSGREYASGGSSGDFYAGYAAGQSGMPDYGGSGDYSSGHSMGNPLGL